ncbi:MAG: hypothetical protein A2Z16_09355 [Chloroflexi bacterium RBG_16_54_18]|nr:MAG: hypothetical protein A2Z16_09355 [Chloroflexi bacterium RBG_16_54_18]
MTTTTQITHMRQKRKAAVRRNPTTKIGQGCGFAIGILIALGAFLSSLGFSSLVQGIPSIEELPNLLQPPDGILLQPTRFYDRSGEHVIAELRNPLSSDQDYLFLENESQEQLIPSAVISATLASADPGFWRHIGFTFVGLFQEEQPTLAQSLASEFLLPGERAGWRKSLRERLLAFQLTSQFGRNKVLEWYLNSANYGHMAYGVDAAARLYLDKSAASLSLAEAALLAGILEDPAMNPLDNPLAALERQKFVILKMLEHRLISPQDGIVATREQLAMRSALSNQDRFILDIPQIDITPVFTRLALNQLETQFRRSQIERGGLRVITTLDFDLYQKISCIARYQIARLENQTGTVPMDVENCPAFGLLPELQPSANTESLNPLIELQILNPHSGQIVLMSRFPDSATDFPSLNLHPAGSLSTPFIYLTAFTQGFSPSTLAWDIPPDESSFDVENFIGQYHGPVRLRTALVNDYLAPAIQLLDRVGEADIVRISQQIGLLPAGFTPFPDSSPVDLFGEISLMQATQAFGVFANQGVRAGRDLSGEQKTTFGGTTDGELSSTAVLRVEDYRGNVLLDWTEAETRPILIPQLSYLITDVLADEPARWPSLGSPNYLEVDRPAAVKIGRTLDGGNSWVVGYTPQFVVGIWAGSQDSGAAGQAPLQPAGRYEEAAIGLWSVAVKSAHQNLTSENWPVPSGVSFIEVCDPSGMLPTSECPVVVKEVFLEGNEPRQEDTLYQAFQVNQATGLLASLFTPPDLLERRVFMVVPPEVQPWAHSSGLQLPPDSYDAIPNSQQKWGNAAILSPVMFEVVRGVVSISGTAAGPDFTGYRLQVGGGLSPQSWYQTGEDATSQVVNGDLGFWDTTGLDGLYAIQLLVIHQDKSIQRSGVLVTVDNQPPTVEVAHPLDGAHISSKKKSELVVGIQAEDNLNLEKVSIYLDGELLTTLFQPPYAVLWKTAVGEHTIRVLAVDKAGNQSEHSIQFIVD